MTIVVTRNVASRFRGFLASCMCEVAPGVYVAPKLNRGVRARIWVVLESWFVPSEDDEVERSILMCWRSKSQAGGLEFSFLGLPTQSLADHDGVFLAKRELTSQTTQQGPETDEEDGSMPSAMRGRGKKLEI